jgi:hypothetical protein
VLEREDEDKKCVCLSYASDDMMKVRKGREGGADACMLFGSRSRRDQQMIGALERTSVRWTAYPTSHRSAGSLHGRRRSVVELMEKQKSLRDEANLAVQPYGTLFHPAPLSPPFLRSLPRILQRSPVLLLCSQVPSSKHPQRCPVRRRLPGERRSTRHLDRPVHRQSPERILRASGDLRCVLLEKGGPRHPASKGDGRG